MYSHSVTLFKCGGTGWTRTSLRFVTNRKNKKDFGIVKTRDFLKKNKNAGSPFSESRQMKGQIFAAFHSQVSQVGGFYQLSSKHVVDGPSALHCPEYVSSSIFSPISPCKEKIFRANIHL